MLRYLQMKVTLSTTYEIKMWKAEAQTTSSAVPVDLAQIIIHRIIGSFIDVPARRCVLLLMQKVKVDTDCIYSELLIMAGYGFK